MEDKDKEKEFAYEQLARIHDIVCSGHDGKLPLTTRTSLLESKVDQLEHKTDRHSTFCNQIQIEDRKAKWYIASLVTVAILGWISAVISHLK